MRRTPLPSDVWRRATVITMEDTEFYEAVRRRGGLESDDEAEAATEAVLATLSERVTDGAAADVAGALPDAVADPLANAGEAEAFGRREFLARVADRADESLDAARRRARAVLAAVDDAAPEEDVAALREQLPDSFATVFEPGERFTDESFAGAVADAAGDLDAEAARDTATATLRTLGERLSAGEASDLATYLPPSFADPLVAAAPQEPPSFPVEEFVSRIADRTETDEETAASRAGAVLGVVARAAGETEVRDVLSQLPDEYLTLFDRAGERGEGRA